MAWLLIGAGGHASAMASVIRGRGDRVAAISRPNDGLDGTAGGGLEGQEQARTFHDDDDAVAHAVECGLRICVAIGNNEVRHRIVSALQAGGHAELLQPLIAASATVDPGAKIGAAVQVCEHAHVGPGASVGQGVIVNTGSVVEHGARVGSASHLAPQSALLGDARVGHSVFMGSGARVLPAVSVSAVVIVGAGAVVTRSIEGTGTYGGVPARLLSSMKGQRT